MDYGLLRNIFRYLGMEKSGFDFWASLCSHDVHPVGWAASNDLIILPPRSIEKTQVSATRTLDMDSRIHFQRDWKRYIVEKLEGRHTFPKDFETAAEEELKTEGLKVGMHLEIMDNRCVRRTRIATIDKLTGGGRISVKYFVSIPFPDSIQARSDFNTISRVLKKHLHVTFGHQLLIRWAGVKKSDMIYLNMTNHLLMT